MAGKVLSGHKCCMLGLSKIKDFFCLFYSCKDGEFRRYQGARTKTDFINFISDQEWKSIEPVSSWFGPSSFL